MGGEQLLPHLADPVAVVGVGIGGVEQVTEAVAGCLVFGGVEDLRPACIVVAKEHVAFRSDRVAAGVDFPFEHLRHRCSVVGVQVVEPLLDGVDFRGREDLDCFISVGGPAGAAGARQERTPGARGDGHRVGVGDRPTPAEVGDASFEHREQQPPGGGDDGGQRWETVRAGIFRCGTVAGRLRVGRYRRRPSQWSPIGRVGRCIRP